MVVSTWFSSGRKLNLTASESVGSYGLTTYTSLLRSCAETPVLLIRSIKPKNNGDRMIIFFLNILSVLSLFYQILVFCILFTRDDQPPTTDYRLPITEYRSPVNGYFISISSSSWGSGLLVFSWLS